MYVPGKCKFKLIFYYTKSIYVCTYIAFFEVKKKKKKFAFLDSS